MKFFLTILPLIIGSSSGSQNVGSVGTSSSLTVGPKVEPRGFRNVFETGHRLKEPTPANLYYQYYPPYDGHGYLPAHEPARYPPVHLSAWRSPFVEAYPSYGYHLSQSYIHPYPHVPHPYLTPHRPVYVPAPFPVSITVPFSSESVEHHRASPIHVNHVVSRSPLFSAAQKSLQSVQYSEEPAVEQPKIEDKKVEEAVVGGGVSGSGSVYQGTSVQFEPEITYPVRLGAQVVVSPTMVPVVVPDVASEVTNTVPEVQPEVSSDQSSDVKYSEDVPITVSAAEKLDYKKFVSSKNRGINKKTVPTNKKPLKKPQELVLNSNEVPETAPNVVADNSPVVTYYYPSEETDARTGVDSAVIPAVSVVSQPVAAVSEQVPAVLQSDPVVPETVHETVPVVSTVPEQVQAAPEVVKAVPVQAVIMAEVPAPVETSIVVSLDPVSQQVDPKVPEPVKQA